MLALTQLQQQLSTGLSQLKLSLDKTSQQRLLHYLDLLAKWNKVYNLTSVRSPEEMVTRHLLDSLSIAPYVQGESILDVGAGAGLPGIPLAIVCGDFHFTLLDSNGKKTRFMTQAVHDLGLTNVTVVQARVETLPALKPFNTIAARAYASLAQLHQQTAHILAAHGQILAMKGSYPEQELLDLAWPSAQIEVKQLSVPGLHAERHLVIISS